MGRFWAGVTQSVTFFVADLGRGVRVRLPHHVGRGLGAPANLGDDADTTGAICGQLAGAYWGESGISAPLRSGLARMDMLERVLTGIIGE